jgi:hypothetical protein
VLTYFLKFQFERDLAVVAGALLAAALYFLIAIGNANTISEDGFGYAALVGLISIPVAAIAVNCRYPNIWTVIAGLAVAAAMFYYLFLAAFVAGLPGSEYAPTDLVRVLLLFPAVAAAMLALRSRRSLPALAASLACCFVVIAVGLQLATRYAIGNQIEVTRVRGGCVLAGYKKSKQVSSVSDVDIGLFIGPRSEQLIFVEGREYFRWSYSTFGLTSRRGFPLSFPVKGDIACS